jgi:hypothetical protein
VKRQARKKKPQAYDMLAVTNYIVLELARSQSLDNDRSIHETPPNVNLPDLFIFLLKNQSK